MASYRDAGVDRDAARETVERIRKVAAAGRQPAAGDRGAGVHAPGDAAAGGAGSNRAPASILDIGGFAAAVAMPQMAEPVILSATDGVGTKLEVALAHGAYETVGIDCVAMCVNDLICHGARPLFFLDYLACGRLEPEVAERIVAGVAEGCRQAGCSLVGGETAEMPGFYLDGRYDIAGFAVGLAERSELIDGTAVREGDILIGLPSTGVHSNGFSLVRHVVTDYGAALPAAGGGGAGGAATVADALLQPTRIYVDAIRRLTLAANPHGIAHITGGGFAENVPRMWRGELDAVIDKDTLPKLPIFAYLAGLGIEEPEMYETFNMGVGMVVAVAPEEVHAALDAGDQARVIGTVQAGSGEVHLT